MMEKAKCGCPLQRLGPNTISVGHQKNCKDAKARAQRVKAAKTVKKGGDK